MIRSRLKVLTVKHLKQAVRDMRPGILLVRKADNQIMAFWSQIPECLDIDYDQFMLYYKEEKHNEV